MQKLKKKNLNKQVVNLYSSVKLPYNPFLKNNLFNQKQFKYPQLFENVLLFRNRKFNVFEFNKFETILHSAKYKVSKFQKKMASCKLFFKSNRLFLNFRLKHFIIQNFNKIKLNQIYTQNIQNQQVVGRILKQTRRYTQILLSVFGILFIIRTKNLHPTIDLLMKNKYVYFKRKKKNFLNNNKDNKAIKPFKINKYFKLEQGRKMLSKYKYKLLRFKVISINNNLTIFSRRAYLKSMFIKNKNIKLSLFEKKKKYLFNLKQYLLYLKEKKIMPKQPYKYKKKRKKKK